MEGSVRTSPAERSATLLAAWIAVLVAVPSLVVLLYRNSQTDYLSHWPICLLLAGILLWRALAERDEEADDGKHSTGGSPVWSTCLVAGLLLAIAGGLLPSPWLGSLGLFVALLALLRLQLGRTRWTGFVPAWLMAVTVLPLPFSLDRTLVLWLQNVCTRLGSMWLDYARIPNLASGVAIRTPDQTFFLEEACSGVNSLYSVMTLTLFWVLWQRYGWARSVALLSLGFVAVILGNSARVWLIVYGDAVRDWNLSAEPTHSVLGAVLFTVMLGLVLSADRLFSFVLPTSPVEVDNGVNRQSVVTLKDLRIPAFSPGLILIAVVVAGFAAFSSTRMAAASLGAAELVQNNLEKPDAVPVLSSETMPARIGEWNMMDHRRAISSGRNEFGVVSERWTYSDGTQPVVVSLDGPYKAFHDLYLCYSNIGWELVQTDESTVEVDTGDSASATRLHLKHEDGRYAVVLFGCFDAQGRAVEPSATHGQWYSRFLYRFGIQDGSSTVAGDPVQPPVHQVQVYFETQDAEQLVSQGAFDEMFRAAYSQFLPLATKREGT